MLCLIESEDLLVFINGEVAPPPSPSQDYVVWRRRDRSVKGWILGALSDQLIQLCVGFDTARDVWLNLENKCTQPPPADGQDKDYHEYLALYKAALRGDWYTTKGILKQDPEAAEARVASTLETALHVAVGTGVALEFVANLVQATSSDEVLALKDRLGRNALHTAALTGNMAAARVLVGRAPALLYVEDHKALFPIHLAARSGHRSTLEFLISQTEDNFKPNPFADASGVLLLCFVIDADFYDIALRLVEKYPHLARMKDYESNRWGLERISNKKSSFPSGAKFPLESVSYTPVFCWRWNQKPHLNLVTLRTHVAHLLVGSELVTNWYRICSLP
ncbi:hypothetical protein ACS0TY_000747 [Phlomoides rotata]